MESEKQNKANKAKQKQTHRYTDPTSGRQRSGVGLAKEVKRMAVHVFRYKINKSRGCDIAQRMQSTVLLYANKCLLDLLWKSFHGVFDCQKLHCTPETNTVHQLYFDKK